MNMTPTRAAITTSVVRAFRASGRSNAGTPFETASTPVIALHPSANARRSSNRPSVSGATTIGATPTTVGGVTQEGPRDTDCDEAEHRDEEDVCRDRKDRAALADAPQVHEHHGDDGHGCQLDAVLRESPWECGRDRGDSGGDAHGDSQHVVGQERRGRDQAG